MEMSLPPGMSRKWGPNWGYHQFRVIFGQKLGWGWFGGCKLSKIVIMVVVVVAKSKEVVVDVGFGVVGDFQLMFVPFEIH